MIRWIAAIAAAAIVSAAAANAQEDPAKNYPSKPVRVLVGLAAGGGTDYLARMYADRMFGGQSRVFIENKTGAGGNIAAEAVARATPDGYTLMVAPAPVMTLSFTVYSKLPYKQDEFAPVARLATYPYLFVTNAELPIKTVKDMVAWAKANPKRSNWGGSGSIFQVLSVLFTQQTGVPVEYIQYRASNEVALALLANELAMSILDAGPVSAPIKNGKLRALAISTPERTPLYPDLPTFAEQGFAGMSYHSWAGLFAPAGTPPAIIQKLEAEVLRLSKLPDLQQALFARETEAAALGAAEFARIVATETARFGAVAKEHNIRLD
jgi:tripartite-type tricarboxylate transporter receptor subunit TctC